jgi:ribosomal protein S18 acetylase RimI-like enzyme
MTDVLGTCLAWGDGVCVVAPDGEGDRTPVGIRIADIVSGKPVPPRPSARLRVEPREAQVRALALWPDLVTEPLGDWVLRRSPTATARRANSVLAFGPAGLGEGSGGEEAAYERVVAWYDRPVAAVLPDSAEDALFRGHGWAAESNDDDTLFQLAGVAAVRRALRAAAVPDVDVTLTDLADGVVVARLGDLASGVAAYDADWVGFRSIEVRPDARRRGLGLAVMDALLGWGAEQGATTAYLQVLADNAPARALYTGLGFVTHHAYRYLAAPGR